MLLSIELSSSDNIKQCGEPINRSEDDTLCGLITEEGGSSRLQIFFEKGLPGSVFSQHREINLLAEVVEGSVRFSAKRHDVLRVERCLHHNFELVSFSAEVEKRGCHGHPSGTVVFGCLFELGLGPKRGNIQHNIFGPWFTPEHDSRDSAGAQSILEFLGKFSICRPTRDSIVQAPKE
jgi:hypothetical protein